MNFRLEMNPLNEIKRKRGLQDIGRVQKFVDSECIRLMAPYTPFLSGILEKAATLGTKIGSGEIRQITPYAKYLYYGKLMVSSITGSAWARHGEKKVLTDKDLNYNKSAHPLAGKMWFARMVSDHRSDILKDAQKVANRGGI